MKRNGVLTANDHKNVKKVCNKKNVLNVIEILIYPCTQNNKCENLRENKGRCFAKYKKKINILNLTLAHGIPTFRSNKSIPVISMNI